MPCAIFVRMQLIILPIYSVLYGNVSAFFFNCAGLMFLIKRKLRLHKMQLLHTRYIFASLRTGGTSANNECVSKSRPRIWIEEYCRRPASIKSCAQESYHCPRPRAVNATLRRDFLSRDSCAHFRLQHVFNTTPEKTIQSFIHQMFQ